MRMLLRWFGQEEDNVPLEHFTQVPGVEGVAWALHHKPAGEVWPREDIKQVKEHAEAFGLNIEVVESLNIHEDIKLGRPSRDDYIENYKKTINIYPKQA